MHTSSPAHPLPAGPLPKLPTSPFTGDAISQAGLEELLRSARRAAVARQSQALAYIAGRPGSDAWQTIQAAVPEAHAGWLKRAAALVVALCDVRGQAQVLGPIHPLGAIEPHTASAISALAVPALLADWAVEDVTNVNAASLRASFGIPAEFEIVAVMALGRTHLAPTIPTTGTPQARRRGRRGWTFAR